METLYKYKRKYPKKPLLFYHTNIFYLLSCPLYFHIILSRDSRDWRETKKEKDSQANLTDHSKKNIERNWMI